MSRKKKLAIGASVTAALLLICIILAVALKRDGGTPDTTEHFRIPDYTLDITTVSEYMDKDRFITYTYGAESIGLDESNQNSFGKGVAFFVKYFKTLTDGDTEGYNALFTDEYYTRCDPAPTFTKQMIYDQRVEKIKEDSSGAFTEYVFAVTYRIYKNDGTFRREIGSDGAKVQFFYLTDKSGEVLIDKITDKYE